MAFDFLGTFNKSQHDRFSAFAKAQLNDVLGRILHLTAERIRVGSIQFGYTAGGSPTGFVSSPTSYIGRLMACYEVLGGDPERDLNLRSITQPVYLLPGDETKPAQMYSNGEVKALPGLADGVSALLGQAAREWMPDVLQYKREYLERKIRRMLDYSDQLQDEIDRLKNIVLAKDTEGSLAWVLDQINQLIADPQYRAIFDDRGKDIDGKTAYAPFKPYEDGPDRTPADTIGRGQLGVTQPGEVLTAKTTPKAAT